VGHHVHTQRSSAYVLHARTHARVHTNTHTHTHNRLTAFVRDNPGRPVPEETHPLTPNLIIRHSLSSSSIYNDPWVPTLQLFLYKQQHENNISGYKPLGLWLCPLPAACMEFQVHRTLAPVGWDPTEHTDVIPVSNINLNKILPMTASFIFRQSNSRKLTDYHVNLLLRTAFFFCLSVTAPRAWNELPDSLRSILTVDSFKSALKTFLFNSQTPTDDLSTRASAPL